MRSAVGGHCAGNDKGSPQSAVHSAQSTVSVGGIVRGAFVCLVEIAASRFAPLAMTNWGVSPVRP
ncbi:MAG: hypothetical protein LBL66_08515 [Clostridiales bacterium]|nr:hypothetical protein [Clostridiales bacterium]